MKLEDFMQILQNDMREAVFATVDSEGKPHARFAYIGVANKDGIFFMTSPTTNFYQQLTTNPNIAITAMSKDNYLVQVMRIEGKVREIGKERLEEILKDNPYVEQVYPSDEVRQGVQAFHVYEGDCFYHSMSQGHKYTFKF